MSNRQHILTLFDKYIANECSEQEIAALLDLFHQEENKDLAEEIIHRHLSEHRGQNPADEAIAARVFEKLRLTEENISAEQPLASRTRIFPFIRVAAASVLLVLTTLVAYYFISNDRKKITADVAEDVAPGGNRAMLILSDGRQLSLAKMQLGSTTEEDGMIIRKSADGQVEYSSGAHAISNTGMNSIRTPRGGQFRLVLPDGSKVWLNAASSLTYPSVFSDGERRVKLTGEGYFEIAPKLKNKKKVPFVVETDKQQIEVLGTKFNVNAYEDEAATKTTLIEGKVKVVTENETVILKPNQEFILRSNGIITQPVEVDMAIDWTNGDFIFANDDIYNVVRKITRWYNVEAVFDDPISPVNINGQISRDRNLSEVLRVLELSGNLKFKIENGIIHISQER